MFFGNFGIGIIILTLFVRVLLFPLANKSFKSMNAMKLLTPEIQRLKERFKDDKTRMNQEMFNLYKQKNKSSCGMFTDTFTDSNFFCTL